MKYNFQPINFNPSLNLKNLIKKRINKLELFYDKILSIKVCAKEKSYSTLNKEIEFIISVPGDQLVVKKRSNSFEFSLYSVSTSVERLLKKHNDKTRSN